MRTSFVRSIALKYSDVLWVIIPCRNEEELIGRCLDSFREQTDPLFQLVVVNNGSTDRTKEIVLSWAQKYPWVPIHIVDEPTAGIGPACRAGGRHCLVERATMIARTDADCQVDSQWVAGAKRSLVRGYDFVIGRCEAQTDYADWPLRLRAIMLLWLVKKLVHFRRMVKNLPHTSDIMIGFNLALSAELYARVGGFTDDPQVNEDIELHNRILRLTTNGTFNGNMVVTTSLRRIKEHGLFKTLWYYHKRKL